MRVIQVIVTKVNRTIDIDVDSLTPSHFEHAMRKGLNNLINDANANAVKKDGATDDEIFSLSQKAASALLDGSFRIVHSTHGAAVTDPVEKEAFDNAKLAVRARMRAMGKKFADNAAMVAAAHAELAKNRDWYMTQAEKIVALKTMAPEADDAAESAIEAAESIDDVSEAA